LNMADHIPRRGLQPHHGTMKRLSPSIRTPGGLVGCETPEALVATLESPRKIVLLVKAGGAVARRRAPAPLLDKGDILIDGGNSLWTDTIRREKDYAAKGILFMGSGVSGGEEGTSSRRDGWDRRGVEGEPIWTAIAAKVDEETGKPIEGAARQAGRGRRAVHDAHRSGGAGRRQDGAQHRVRHDGGSSPRRTAAAWSAPSRPGQLPTSSPSGTRATSA
jgi:hypothetical protein